MKDSNLRVLETFLAYSLSKQRTTTKLFLVEYEQAMKGNLVEISLEDLITRLAFYLVLDSSMILGCIPFD